MINILLLLDNAVELDFVRTVLSKLDFNILSRQVGADMHTKLQSMSPDLVMISNIGAQQKSLHDLMKVKESKGFPKFVWIGAGERFKKLDINSRKIIDKVLPTPIQPEGLIEAVCVLTNLDVNEYLQKYHKLFSKSFAQAKPQKSKLSFYKAITEKIEVQDQVLSIKDLKKRSDQMTGDKNTEDLLMQKREFLRTLFKK